jgi:hypothetical protein
VRVVRGLIELADGDVRAARDEAELALAMDTSYTIPGRSLLIRTYAAEGDATRAGVEIARLYKELGSGDPSPTNARFVASALMAVGRANEAIAVIERARPRGAYLWFYLHSREFRPLLSDPRFQKVFQEADPTTPADSVH